MAVFLFLLPFTIGNWELGTGGLGNTALDDGTDDRYLDRGIGAAVLSHGIC